MFNKAFAIAELVSGAVVLTVSIPTLIVSHAKSMKEKEEKEKDYRLSHECTRDTIMVTGMAGGLALLATKVIVDGIKVLKH